MSQLLLCTDPDCPVAWAYRDPPADHYHPRPHGPELPEPPTWAELLAAAEQARDNYVQACLTAEGRDPRPDWERFGLEDAPRPDWAAPDKPRPQDHPRPEDREPPP